jgi:hypothetical protein
MKFFPTLLEHKQKRKVPGGEGTGPGSNIVNASVLPLLTNNDSLPAGLGNVVEIGGDPINRAGLADTDFEYESQQWDFNIDLITHDVYSNRRVSIDTSMGLGMTYFLQDFELRTEGINNNTQGLAKTSTHEILDEFLIGARAGIHAQAKLSPPLTLQGSLVAGYYGEFVQFNALQEFFDVSFVGSNCVHSFNIVREFYSNRDTVPRLTSQVGLLWQLSPTVALSAQYHNDTFWFVSNVDNPTAGFDSGRGIGSIDHEVRLGTEHLVSHFIEVRADLEF